MVGGIHVQWLADKSCGKMAQARKNRNVVGPYSRRLRRGVIGDMVDGRSTIGRFYRDLEAQLVWPCGRAPSIAQWLLIDRLIRTIAQLNALDSKLMSGGAWTDHDSRSHNGLVNRQWLLFARGRFCAGETRRGPLPRFWRLSTPSARRWHDGDRRNFLRKSPNCRGESQNCHGAKR